MYVRDLPYIKSVENFLTSTGGDMEKKIYECVYKKKKLQQILDP